MPGAGRRGQGRLRRSLARLRRTRYIWLDVRGRGRYEAVSVTTLRFFAWRSRVVRCLVCGVVAACASAPLQANARGQSAGAAAVTYPAVASCSLARTRPSNSGFPEVRGVGSRGVTLWALLFYTPPAVAGTDLKIVLKMTGTGSFRVRALGPGGMVVRHRWIEPHGGSNWNRPGDEWGTGWRLPVAGCWRLHATRGRGSGEVWLKVAPAR